MIIYTKDDELYTEEEARDIAANEVELNEYYIEDLFNAYSEIEIWNMINEDKQVEIFEACVQDVLDNKFNCRNFLK